MLPIALFDRGANREDAQRKSNADPVQHTPQSTEKTWIGLTYRPKKSHARPQKARQLVAPPRVAEDAVFGEIHHREHDAHRDNPHERD